MDVEIINRDKRGDEYMKNILILNTGGTFSSEASGHGLAPSITGVEIVQKLGILDDDISISVEDFCSLDSANIMPDDWVSIARKIAGSIADYSGFIVIHGTDTLLLCCRLCCRIYRCRW